jgi:hypothetical protein
MMLSESLCAALEANLAPDVRLLLAHPLYGELRSLDDMKSLMSEHVFAVWDFMSLLKGLQRRLTCVTVPWLPSADPETTRFVNEIVLGEESDDLGDGLVLSHCELYLRAMEEVGADASAFRRFIGLVAAGDEPAAALAAVGAPAHVRDFVCFSLETARGPVHRVAAGFLYGRENVIPDMFRRILANVKSQRDVRLKAMTLYLDRHIEVDEGSHGPLARRLLQRICGEDRALWREVEDTARRSIAARRSLWDGVLSDILSARRASGRAAARVG